MKPAMFWGQTAACGVNLKEIAGTKSKTDWANMALWQHCEQQKSWDQASPGWLNILAVTGTLLSIKGQGCYVWAPGHVRGTATLVWPSVAAEAAGKKLFTLASARAAKSDWRVCLGPDDWE
eukprot:6769916-Prorocentrum_lima.AAC.1